MRPPAWSIWLGVGTAAETIKSKSCPRLVQSGQAEGSFFIQGAVNKNPFSVSVYVYPNGSSIPRRASTANASDLKQ